MKDIYLWLVTAVTAAVAVNTVMRLWTDRDRLGQEDLLDEDRLFAWRIVLFLIYPLMTLIDLRSTVVATESLGGYISNWTYGLFWYAAVPEGLHNTETMLLALFAGCAVQVMLALSLLPALFFRPHPFLANVIGYSIVAVLGVNLIVDPLLSLVGMGGSRWQLAMTTATPQQKLWLAAGFAVAAALFLAVVFARRTRLWFAHLSRPLVADLLIDAQAHYKLDPDSAYANARLALLCERAGLRRQANRQMRRLQALYPRTIYSAFVEAMLSYRQRRYKNAREQFLFAADCPHVDAPLRGTLLAAAACAAFAEGDLQGALNLSERALEFDDALLVARMVKVDVFMRTGRKEQAGDEIVAALRRGLDIDLDHQIPLDSEAVLLRISRLQSEQRIRPTVGSRN